MCWGGVFTVRRSIRLMESDLVPGRARAVISNVDAEAHSDPKVIKEILTKQVQPASLPAPRREDVTPGARVQPCI